MRKYFFSAFLFLSAAGNLYIGGSWYLARVRQKAFEAGVLNVVEKVREYGTTTVVIPEANGQSKKYELVLKP